MLNYVIGDATEPQGEGVKIIAHIVNDLGLWGSGFVVPLGKKYPKAKESYQQWARGTDEWFGLGEVELVQVTDNIYVANMVAQRGVRNGNYTHPLQYDALDDCLWLLDMHADSYNASVHMPRIGCGLAGGNWEKVFSLIERYSLQHVTTVYDLE
jgi:O-acetyl-ADP-ribose deacetylase (regulator of RNase III)